MFFFPVAFCFLVVLSDFFGCFLFHFVKVKGIGAEFTQVKGVLRTLFFHDLWIVGGTVGVYRAVVQVKVDAASRKTIERVRPETAPSFSRIVALGTVPVLYYVPTRIPVPVPVLGTPCVCACRFYLYIKSWYIV